jgi:hypothetical protein
MFLIKKRGYFLFKGLIVKSTRILGLAFNSFETNLTCINYIDYPNAIRYDLVPNNFDGQLFHNLCVYWKQRHGTDFQYYKI